MEGLVDYSIKSNYLRFLYMRSFLCLDKEKITCRIRIVKLMFS